jgi:serine/threonine protein kinase
MQTYGSLTTAGDFFYPCYTHLMPDMFPIVPGYTFQAVLGRGGFGTTYLATRNSDGLRCVVKQLAMSHMENWKSLELFEREAQTLAQLQHAFIPKLLEVRRDPQNGQPAFLMVQSYIPGHSLRALIEAGKRFTVPEALALGIALAKILVYLHSFSPPLVHRDIKPENIILGDDQQWYLIDFGAVRRPDQAPEDRGSTTVGTLGYMAPEQLHGMASPASDIYALGATLLFALTHRAPYELPLKGLKINFRPVFQGPGRVANLLDKMLAPEAQQRYPNALELLTDLEALAAGKTPPGLTSEAPFSGFTPPPPRPDPTKKYIAAMFALFILCMALVTVCSLPDQQVAPRDNYDAVRERLENAYQQQYEAEFGSKLQLPTPSPSE